MIPHNILSVSRHALLLLSNLYDTEPPSRPQKHPHILTSLGAVASPTPASRAKAGTDTPAASTGPRIPPTHPETHSETP